MVKYYGRARQRIGSVNTNQLGLKMSGCPSKVGRRGAISRNMQKRVSCMRGICGIPLVNGTIWRYNTRNMTPYCKRASNKCLAAAGGIRTTYVPYYKTIAPGKAGCGYTDKNVLRGDLIFVPGTVTISGVTYTGYASRAAASAASANSGIVLGKALINSGVIQGIETVVQPSGAISTNVTTANPITEEITLIVKSEGKEEKATAKPNGTVTVTVDKPVILHESTKDATESIVEVSIRPTNPRTASQ